MKEYLSAFADGEADILVGTQMIVKGHDFPAVTLVGVLAADMSLYSSDYRSGERTFQLLDCRQQVVREEESAPGEVVIQTYDPEHYSITNSRAKSGLSGDFIGKNWNFSELGWDIHRCENMLAVLMMGEEENLLNTAAEYLKAYAERIGRQLSGSNRSGSTVYR